MRRTNLHKQISRLMAVLLCAILILPMVPAARAAESGSCGDNLTWTLADGTLTISGSGPMANYAHGNYAPWYHSRESIYYLSLPEGLTRVGDYAFYECKNLTSVTIPATVTDIGEVAFFRNKSMTMLTLNSGLRTIGRSAFERCSQLQDLRIPNTVTTIGKHAFYVCSSLQYVIIPSSVTSMGTGVFGYCDNLARVDMEASIDEIPFATFLGCDSLGTVTMDGKSLDTKSLTAPEVGTSGQQNAPSTEATVPNNKAESMDLENKGNGEYQISGTTTTKTDNATISKTESTTLTEDGKPDTTETDISASITDSDGWNELVDQIESVQKENETEQKPGTGSEDSGSKLGVTVYVPENNVIPKTVLKELAGSNLDLTVNTQSGASFKIDASVLEESSIKSDLDLSYTLSQVETPEGIDSNLTYQLVFNKTNKIPVEALIRLPRENARRSASLYQREKKDGYSLIQSVLVDDEGYAHYYLGSIDRKTIYLIAMDVPGEQSAQAMIPDVLHEEYKLVDQATGKEYVVTGRTSSWGVGLGQVMGILAGVMIGVIVLVGVIMFLWNKQRLKNGYVPQWDDEE